MSTNFSLLHTLIRMITSAIHIHIHIRLKLHVVPACVCMWICATTSKIMGHGSLNSCFTTVSMFAGVFFYFEPATIANSVNYFTVMHIFNGGICENLWVLYQFCFSIVKRSTHDDDDDAGSDPFLWSAHADFLVWNSQ